MDSNLGDALLSLVSTLTRFGAYITQRAENWQIRLIEKYKRY
jgi:hypothetical protein